MKVNLLAVAAIVAIIGTGAIVSLPNVESAQVKGFKAEISNQYLKAKFTSAEQYKVTAAQQAMLYWQADKLLTTADADRFIATPDAVVGEVVELQFSHGGNSYQAFRFYEKGKKKFFYLQRVE